MLAPKNNFSLEASIPPVPTHALHPAPIGGWREAAGEAAREAERETRGEAGGRLEREAGREAGGETERRRLCETEKGRL